MSKERNNLIKFIRQGTPEAVIERYLALEGIAEDSKFDQLEDNVVVVDTEATGLSYKKDELIQIAAAKIEKGKISDWYVTFVNPGQEISEDIEHLTHISNQDVADAPSPSEALEGLVDFTGDALMLAHNASFDKTFLTKHAAGYPLLENKWADTLELARIAFPRLTSHRLIDLAKAFSAVESTHRADDDVATTVQIYKLILAAITQMPYDMVKVIANLAGEEMWPTSYVFKQMLNIMPQLDDPYANMENENDNFEILQNQIEQHNIFGETNATVNVFSMLKTMRNERFIDLPSQKKFDLDMGDDLAENYNEDVALLASNSMQFPTEKDLAHEFSEDGILGKIYSDYEKRDEQLSMANQVLSSFQNSQNLVIEAGTGVGKSMAYLVPSIEIAKENNITIGVATKTNSLLDQLIYHELPALKSEIENLVYSSLKGARHYVCLRKAAYLATSKAKNVSFKNETFCNAPSIAALLSYIEQTCYDDCDGLKINGRALPNAAYTCPSHECLRHKCPFYRHGCFVHGARKLAQNSDIVVTNHSMLFCDMKANGGLMPPIRYWIVDEAHNTEAEARKAFSSIVSASALLEIAKGLESTSPKLNVFERADRTIDVSSLEYKDEQAQKLLQEQIGKNVIYGMLKKCKELGIVLSNKAYLYANNLNTLLDAVPRQKSGYEFRDV